MAGDTLGCCLNQMLVELIWRDILCHLLVKAVDVMLVALSIEVRSCIMPLNTLYM